MFNWIALGLGVAQAVNTVSAYNSSTDAYEEDMAAVLNAGQENAKRAKEEGAIKLYEAQYEARQLRGSNMAAFAASGGGITGSALDVLVAQDIYNKFNEDTIKYDANLETRAALISSYNQAVQLTSQQESRRINTIGSLINVAAGTYQSMNEYRNIKAINASQVQTAATRAAADINSKKTIQQFKYGSDPTAGGALSIK